MVSIVTWLWQGSRAYLPEHVNTLAGMFRRTLSIPHNFICISDTPDGFSPCVQVMPMPESAGWLTGFLTPEGEHFPSCYRRLWMFSEDAKVLGDRVLLVDIDMIVMRDTSHLFDAKADFVGWQPRTQWGDKPRIGGGIYLLTPGARTDVYEDFCGPSSIREARAAGYRGSDQAWMSYKLQGCEVWPDGAGIYSQWDVKGHLDKATIVQFNGKSKPWNSKGWHTEYWK